MAKLVSEVRGPGGRAEVYLWGEPPPRDSAQLRAVAPLFHRRLLRAIEAGGLPGDEPEVGLVVLDAIAPIRRDDAPWQRRTVVLTAPVPFTGWRLSATVLWLGDHDLVALARRRDPGVDERRFTSRLPPERALHLGCWVGSLASLGGADAVVGAIRRFGEAARLENLGAFEDALAGGASGPAARPWLDATNLARRSPPDISRALGRIGQGLLALRAASGRPVPLDPGAERLAAELRQGVPHHRQDAARRTWEDVKAWARACEGDPEAVAYADLLGRAMAASVPDPFAARFAPELEFAAAYALYETLGRARAALGAWEEDPAAAEARWRDLLDG